MERPTCRITGIETFRATPDCEFTIFYCGKIGLSYGHYRNDSGNHEQQTENDERFYLFFFYRPHKLENPVNTQHQESVIGNLRMIFAQLSDDHESG